MLKPTVILVLTFTIIGYIFCSRNYLTKPTFRKTSGYHTFILSAAWGIGLWLVSALLFGLTTLVFFLLSWESGLIAPLLTHFIQVIFPNLYVPLYAIHSFQISIIALFLALKGPSIILHFVAKMTGESEDNVANAVYYSLSATDDTPEFTQITTRSMTVGLPIAFTLSNSKVYIGYPTEIAFHMNDIMILPLKSGYRCENEQRLELVTDYVPVWDDIREELSASQEEEVDLDLDRFLINIPVREIVHANLHDFHYRKNFEKYERPKKKSYIPENTVDVELEIQHNSGEEEPTT
ncbi:hypothetical protein [Pseudoalteromonas luteoviolacea]|uniref:Uncharacterized protein n=1 Tax=Pseudoalteromonas luteoviolacea NCIMB 1942 TaxID=1365253 RepID=A0A167FW99_9GAMM|nr:hypothetical protein [Pseudoalteromonas luteoviolacea]KZN53296.1 hypothetical protein N482_24975 [Pseudoalteromonas luteoviolacea NCIMB 1942]